MPELFQYGEKEITHLKKVDKKLGKAIDVIGKIEREIMPDLFTALVHNIVSQQISGKARDTVWARLLAKIGEVKPEIIHALPLEELQQVGLSFRKANYIKSAAQKVNSGELDLNSLYSMSDDKVCAKLTQLDGIGVWTAEMLMLFSMQRSNILSYGDLAIHRGMRMLYNKPKIDKITFKKYHEIYSPYASVASLYLWKISGGAIGGVEPATN